MAAKKTEKVEHEHHFIPLGGAYSKQDPDVFYTTVYCTRCAERRELVSADYGVPDAK
jgi:hypothetical protein